MIICIIYISLRKTLTHFVVYSYFNLNTDRTEVQVNASFEFQTCIQLVLRFVLPPMKNLHERLFKFELV